MPINVDPLYAGTSRVRGFRRSIETTSATAFAWTQDSRIYVVTNKHVILGRDFGNNPQPLTSIRLSCHNTTNSNLRTDVSVDLFYSGSPVTLEYTNFVTDLVFIPTNYMTFATLFYLHFSS